MTWVSKVFWADNSRYPLILLTARLHCVAPRSSGVTASIAAAVSANPNFCDQTEITLTFAV
ncbi:hypothetical protein [Kaistella palustris]|uniref:hypothetical protein n=1 Tax=Kaistella palustris TaxID=493376 RepID=UPI000411D421|nr:hypothetical protein [Kaistella palustris]